MASMKTQVKNRAPAPIQISAEQLLREAKERGLESMPTVPRQFITDVEELKLYQQNKRKEFEDKLRRQRQKITLWIKYAEWEASQKEYERARSVFERAIDIDYKHQAVWLKYIEMEIKNKFLNHARNVLDRVVTLLPRIELFWFKYTYMEEYIGGINETRIIFERWMKWEPSDNAWLSYIKFELRQMNIISARNIYERYIKCYPTSYAYLKYAKWEEKSNREYQKAREIYERALVEVHPYERTTKLYISFANFEERSKEYERARIIYQYALDNIDTITSTSHMNEDDDDDNTFVVESKSKNKDDEKKAIEMNELRQCLLNFEKKYGTKQSIEQTILIRRRDHYESEVQSDGYNYDAWFNYIEMEEREDNNDTRIRELYERAISYVPPIAEKKYWRRYIYLWINYAIFEELQAKDIDKTRAVYTACLSVIPHKVFTFGKIWLYAAKFEIRQKDFNTARKILGRGIGMCGKENIFKGYIEIELQLGEMDRCRTLYGKYIETMPWNCTAWKNFAQLEVNLGEIDRARAIYELAIKQPELDMPELLWKTYIDFEINESEYDKARKLYERLLEKTSHVKVWISYAQFEGSISSNDPKTVTTDTETLQPAHEIDEQSIRNIRSIMKRGYSNLKSLGLKEERIMLLECWRELELKAPQTIRDVTAVDNMFPRKIKMRKPIISSNDNNENNELEFEEYYEYQFPDDTNKIIGLKLLENAMKWKKSAMSTTTNSDDNNNSNIYSNDFDGILEGNRKRKNDNDNDDMLLPAKKPTLETNLDNNERNNTINTVADSNEIEIDL